MMLITCLCSVFFISLLLVAIELLCHTYQFAISGSTYLALVTVKYAVNNIK